MLGRQSVSGLTLGSRVDPDSPDNRTESRCSYGRNVPDAGDPSLAGDQGHEAALPAAAAHLCQAGTHLLHSRLALGGRAELRQGPRPGEWRRAFEGARLRVCPQIVCNMDTLNHDPSLAGVMPLAHHACLEDEGCVFPTSVPRHQRILQYVRTSRSLAGRKSRDGHVCRFVTTLVEIRCVYHLWQVEHPLTTTSRADLVFEVALVTLLLSVWLCLFWLVMMLLVLRKYLNLSNSSFE